MVRGTLDGKKENVWEEEFHSPSENPYVTDISSGPREFFEGDYAKVSELKW